MSASMDAWAVAAALLIKSGRPLCYTDLTERVLNTRLSGLGYKGGKTPPKTLRTILGKQTIRGRTVFARVGRGIYTVSDPIGIQSVAPVRDAIQALDDFDLFGNRLNFVTSTQ
jgi:hypothetical protein